MNQAKYDHDKVINEFDSFDLSKFSKAWKLKDVSAYILHNPYDNIYLFVSLSACMISQASISGRNGLKEECFIFGENNIKFSCLLDRHEIRTLTLSHRDLSKEDDVFQKIFNHLGKVINSPIIDKNQLIDNILSKIDQMESDIKVLRESLKSLKSLKG